MIFRRIGRRANRRLAAAMLILAAAPGLAWAQEPPAATPGSGKVASVNVTGSKKFSGPELAKASGIEPGNMVTQSDIQAGADRLGALGWFEKVQYKFITTREGVHVEFTLEDAPTVPVAFDNFPWFSDEELTQAIRADAGIFDGTSPKDGDAVDKMKQALEKLVVAHGIRGTVENLLLAAPGDSGMIQQFRLNGPLMKVGTVEFSDPLPRGEVHVADRLADIVGKPYSRFAIELFSYEYVRPLYLSKGNLRVKFAAPQARLAGDPRKGPPDTVAVTVPIEPGPVYRWAGVTWTGQAAFNEASLNQAIGLTAGDPADGNKIQGAWDRIENEYAKRGYLDAKIDPQPVFDDAAAKVSYRTVITEGVQYRVGQFVVTGLSLAAERELLAGLGLPRGDIFNKQIFDDFIASGARKLFENTAVHFETVGHLLRKHPDTKLVDILLDFQ